jgi:hypothetical protein
LIEKAQWFYHNTAYGKIAINRAKAMTSVAFAIFFNGSKHKHFGDQNNYMS